MKRLFFIVGLLAITMLLGFAVSNGSASGRVAHASTVPSSLITNSSPNGPIPSTQQEDGGDADSGKVQEQAQDERVSSSGSNAEQAASSDGSSSSGCIKRPGSANPNSCKPLVSAVQAFGR